MFTILKKEFRALLRRPLGILFITFSLFFVGLSTAVNNFYDGLAKPEYSLAFLAMVLAIMLPIAVKDIFVKDRKSSADRLYSALGFKSSDVVLGKYGALLTLFAVEVAMLLIIPFVISLFADINFASAYFSVLCFILFGAVLIAMNLFIAAASKNSTVYLIVSYVSTVASFLIYLTPTGNGGFWKHIANVLRFLSPFSSVDRFIIGTFDIASIVYLIILIAVFVFLAVRSYNKRITAISFGKKSPESKKFIFSPALAIILAVATVAASTLVSLVPSKYAAFDISTSKAASISSQAEKYLNSLDVDVNIIVINADSSDVTFEHLLDDMESASKHLNVVYSTQDKMKEKLYTLGWDGSFDLTPYTLIIESDMRTQVVDHSSLYYYHNADFSNIGTMDESTYQSYLLSIQTEAQKDPATYGEMLDSFINKTEKYFCAEALILGCIEYTALENIPQSYYATGHDELEFAKSNISYLLTNSGFLFSELDLTKLSEIPADANCIVINAPANDLSKAESEMLLSYLKKGGALTLITNEANLDMPNLMSLVNAYGVSAEKGLVVYDKPLEEGEDSELTENTSGEGEDEEEPELPDKYLVESVINESHDSIHDLAGYTALVRNGNNISISDDLGSSVIVTKLITSPEKAYIDGVDNSEGIKTLAVAIEEETENGITEIAWFTGAESFDGEKAEAVNLYAAVYSVIWGGEEYVSEVGSINDKLLNDPRIELSSGAKLSLSVTLMLIIPAVFALPGLMKYNKRKKITVQN